MLFKVYAPDGSFLMAESIHELADLCGISQAEARKIYYRKASIVNGFEIINLT
jgi:hypothetical protein